MYYKIFRALFYPILFAGMAFQSYAASNEGYKSISPAQLTQDVNKVEVIEFFWYGCPHCFSFEPLLDKWVKELPENVQFIRQPAVFSAIWGKHAKAYFTAEALGVVDKVHADFFDSIQNKREKLDTTKKLAKFFADHGVDNEAFTDAFNSFLVTTKAAQAEKMAARYGVTGVPAIIVNGKYMVNSTLAGSHKNMIAIMDRLVKEELQKLK